MKYLLFPIILFSVAIPVLAHAPDLTITHIQGQEVIPGQTTIIVIPGLPFVVPVEGIVEHGDPGNISPLLLQATDNGEFFYGPEHPYSGSTETSNTFNIPWTITSAGAHLITVTAKHGNKDDDDSFGGGPGAGAKEHGCKAAPAIAAHYLKDNDSKNKGIVREVAHQTGKKGSLWSRESCSSDYLERTISLIVELE
jgi:hypothetical protein